MALSELAIRNAKTANGKLKKLSDGGGLQLWITCSGSKLWRVAYRFDGKQKLLALGGYPEISLAMARERLREARRLVAEGRDPGEQRKIDRSARQESRATTFGVLSVELIEKKEREGKASRTVEKLRWLMSLAEPALGGRPIGEITAVEILDTLRSVEGRGRLETAKRLRAVIGQVFRFAVATGRAAADPTSALKGALTSPVVKHRAAILDPAEFGALLRAIDGFQGQPTTVAALKLMAYLFPRPGELRLAEWAEFDLEKSIWTIPAARAKMRRAHRVPLPPQAVAILRDLSQVTGRLPLVFAGYGRSGGEGRKIGHRPISENTLNGALRRLGYGPDEMTSHGFRAVASSLLNESGKFSADAVERALAHQDRDAVRRAYARGEFWEERVRMAAWWATEVDRLRGLAPKNSAR